MTWLEPILAKIWDPIATPAAVFVTMFAGQVMTGFSVSLTVTLKVQLAVPQELEAVAVTTVVPTEKAVPGFWE